MDYVVKYYLRYYDQVRNGIMWKTTLMGFQLLHIVGIQKLDDGWMDEFQVQHRIWELSSLLGLQMETLKQSSLVDSCKEKHYSWHKSTDSVHSVTQLQSDP